MNELLVFLLPLAAFTGWWLGRTDKKSNHVEKDDEYFKGLGYLLEDETDKAIDIFVKLVDLDDNAVENQITLGNLFRHRGELDRALHIHTTLTENTRLSTETRQKLNLALADDYYAAGIMNHSESAYQSVRESVYPDMREVARRKLITLYSEQSLWQQAIDVAEELDPFHRDAVQQQVAHFHCEIAEALLKKSPTDEISVENALNAALACDKQCVRASIKLGRLAAEKRNYVAAIGYFQQVETQQASFLPEVLDDMEQCYQAINQPHEWKDELTRLTLKFHNPVLLLRLTKLIAISEGELAAIHFLDEQLRQKPNILLVQSYLNFVQDLVAVTPTEMMHEHPDEKREKALQSVAIRLLQSSVQKILSHTLKYRCRECGFRGNQLNWQCPGCKQWGTFTPVTDISLKENISL